MRHVAHMNALCLTSHVLRMNASCFICEWVKRKSETARKRESKRERVRERVCPRERKETVLSRRGRAAARLSDTGRTSVHNASLAPLLTPRHCQGDKSSPFSRPFDVRMCTLVLPISRDTQARLSQVVTLLTFSLPLSRTHSLPHSLSLALSLSRSLAFSLSRFLALSVDPFTYKT